MRSTLRDVGYAWRLLRRTPYVVLAIVTTVGAAIALATVIGQALLTSLVPPLPFSDADRLVLVHTTMRGVPGWPGYAQYGDFRGWHAQPNGPFATMAARIKVPLNLATSGEGRRLQGAFVSEEYFKALGVTALRGDTARLADRTQVACAIGFRLWRTVFAGRDDIIGQSIRLNDTIATIQAVLPREFTEWAEPTEIWLPIGHYALFAPAREIDRPGYFNATVVARLQPAVSRASAQEQLQSLAREHARRAGGDPDLGVVVVPLRDAEVSPTVQRSIMLLHAATLLAVFVALANAFCVLAARATDRRSEMAIRQALGARRRDLRRHWMLEAALVIVGAACFGVAGAYGLRHVAVRVAGDFAPLVTPESTDSRFGVAAAITVALALALAAIVGAVLTRFALPNEGHENIVRGVVAHRASATRLQSTLLIGQVAVSTMLVVATSALLVTLFMLQRVDFGVDETVTVDFYRVHLPSYEFSAAELPARFESLRRALASAPGVRLVALASDLPAPNPGGTVSITIEGQRRRLNSGAAPTPGRHYVSPDHFRVLGVPLLAGRDFTPDDAAGRVPVAIVNRQMADMFWAGANPVGKRVKFEPDADEPWTEIIGLVEGVRYGGPRNPFRPELYSPLYQQPRHEALVLVRADDRPRRPDHIAQMEQGMRQGVPGVILSTNGRLQDAISTLTAPFRLASLLVCLFAALALLLAAAGVYGLTSQYVSRRTYEMAVRMAIGASHGDVMRLVLIGALWRVAVGVGVGLCGAFFVIAPLLRHYMYGVQPDSALIVSVGVIVLVTAGLLAALGPSVRAARIAPSVTLRAS